MFATNNEIEQAENMIQYILNSNSAWGGSTDDDRRSAEAITKSRKWASLEVIKAIATNPQHGYWGQLAEYLDVDHNDFLPDHVGTHGIPQITPFANAQPIIGKEADPDEVDSYRNDTHGLYTRIAGETVLHDQADSNGMASPVAGFYSIVNNQIKFTGYECAVPVIQIDEELVDTLTPNAFLPTVVKLAVFMNLKEGDNLAPIAGQMHEAGQRDLAAIAAGSMSVSPVSDVMQAQKAA